MDHALPVCSSMFRLWCQRPMHPGVRHLFHPGFIQGHPCVSQETWLSLLLVGGCGHPCNVALLEALCNIRVTAIPKQDENSVMQAAPNSVLMDISSPGMGKMSSPLECTQASASCPGVQPFLSAISFTFSTSLKFCKDVSNDVQSCHSGAAKRLALSASSSPGMWPQTQHHGRAAPMPHHGCQCCAVQSSALVNSAVQCCASTCRRCLLLTAVCEMQTAKGQSLPQAT